MTRGDVVEHNRSLSVVTVLNNREKGTSSPSMFRLKMLDFDAGQGPSQH
jgi:hypothetical protein